LCKSRAERAASVSLALRILIRRQDAGGTLAAIVENLFAQT